MQERILPQAEKYKKSKRRTKLWHRIVSVLACLVVFLTTYSLILPAITMTKTAYCGFEEHVHGPKCFETRLVCGYGSDAASSENSVDFDTIHEHTDECYETQNVLICGLEETPGHIHSDQCKETERILICAEEHEHTDECYQINEIYVCGLAEGEGAHTHSAECYETQNVLICNIDPSDNKINPEGKHVHTDACYENVLICTKQEHTHTLACFSNPEADLETQEIWESTVAAVPLTGIRADDIVAVAESQIGYTESDANYIVMDDGLTIKGYTRYGAWWGEPYIDWSAAFVSFCLYYADIPATVFPYEAVCDRWVNILSISNINLYRSRDEYTPSKGDIVFFDNNSDGIPDDAGIIAATNADEAQLEIIKKDAANTVQKSVYSAYDLRICGYGVLSAQGNEVPPADTTDSEEDISIPEDGVLSDEENGVSPDDATDTGDEINISEDGVLSDEENGVSPDDATDTEDEIIIPEDGSLLDDGNEFSSDSVNSEGEINSSENEELPVHENEILPDFINPEDDIDIPENDLLSVRENMAISEITKIAVIYTDESYLSLYNNETVITLTGVIPEEAEIRAFPVTVEAQHQVLCAFDISIFMPDGTLFEPAEGEKIAVAIHAPELSVDALSDATVYYMPEDKYSEPVPIETIIQDGAVCFEAEHFSIYALMRIGTMPEVYLNGATGNDNNPGTQAAPVKTPEKALSLVADNGTIYVSGTLTVSTAESWSIDIIGVKMQRAAGFTGPLVTVANGGSLNLSNITINGGNGALNPLLINNNSSYSTAYATNFAKAPLIVVNTGGNLTVTDGTVLENNSNKPSTDANGAFWENGYIGLGGAIYCSGTMTMTGGLIQNCEAQCGGGIYVENGSLNLSGGTIYHNYARNILGYNATKTIYRKNAGGGVYVGNNSGMIMSGGTLSYNQSFREGGGISLGWLNRAWGYPINSYITTFTMTGGTFTGNEALSTGGGLNVTAGREATVSAGYFTNNNAYGYESQGGFRVFSGGGIYVDAAQWDSSGNYAGELGKVILHRAIITQNSSDYQGGGIAACPTGISHINGNSDLGNGAAIYNNTAMASVGTYDEIGIKNMTSNDIVNDVVLGGGDYNWTSDPDTSDEWTNYGNSLTDDSSAIVTAKSLATVWITNNHGYLGGGIGNNGILQVGGETGGNFLSLSINKVWEDSYTDHPAFITVQILQNGTAYGDPVNIYKTTDENNQEVWPTYYIDGLPGGYTYTVQEVPIPGYESAVTQNGSSFTITNTRTGFRVVKNWVGDVTINRPASVNVQLYRNGTPNGEPVQLTAANNWLYIWENLPANDGNGDPYSYSVQETVVPDGYYNTGSSFVPENDRWEITNTKYETTSVSAEKRWAAGTTPAASVELQLKADGQNYGVPVVLNAANSWFHRWDNLPKYTAQNALITYTVTENAPGYWPTIAVGDPSQASNGWVPVSALENGKTYLLVNTYNNIDRALSGLIGYQGLQLRDVTSNLDNNTMPVQAALWTYNSTGSTLQNGEGRYIVMMTSSGSYYFYTGTANGKNLSFTDGRLSGVDTVEYKTRYLTGSFSNNYALTSTNPADAMIFTLYTYTNDKTEWGNTHYIVTNETAPASVDLNFSKYSVSGDGSEPTLLSGADLVLYKQDEAGTTIPGTSVTGTLIASWTSGGVGQPDSIHIENLTQGTYYLIETAVPEGHTGLAGPVIFTVDPANAQVVVTEYPGYTDMEGTNLFTGGNAPLPVYNQVAYALPETGGPGTILHTLGGVLLTTAASLLLYLDRKRRNKAHISS